MNIYKIVALILSLTLLSLTTFGYNRADDIPEDDNGYFFEDDGMNPNEPDDAHSHGHIDFNAAIATFPPHTVMLTAGGIELSWAELYVFLFRTVNTLLYSYGGPIEWSEPFDQNQTLAEIVLEFSTDEALNFIAFKYGATELNFQWSSDNLKAFETELEEFFTMYNEMYNDRESMEESLRDNGGFYDVTLFEQFYYTDFMIGLLFEELNGENGASLSNEKLDEFVSEYDFMMAMHILRLKSDDPDADPLGEAEDILAQLNAQKGSDNFTKVFYDLMHEESEDYGGLMSFPNGYLFLHEDMVPEFSDTTASLEIGEMSGIVETMYGYHIILRIPVDYDAVPSGLSREGRDQSLRQLVAFENFNSNHTRWMESLNPVFTAEYNSINLAELFKWHDEDCDH